MAKDMIKLGLLRVGAKPRFSRSAPNAIAIIFIRKKQRRKKKRKKEAEGVLRQKRRWQNANRGRQRLE